MQRRLNCRPKTSLCPKGTFSLPNTVLTRGHFPSHLSSGGSPYLALLCTTTAPFFRTRPIHPPLRLYHSQSAEGTNHMFRGRISSGQHPRPKYLELCCLSPPASLSSTLSLGRGWMLLDGLVGWLQGDKNRGGVMSSSAGTLGGATSVLHWRKKVLPLELMSRRVALSAHSVKRICASSQSG